MGVAPPLNPPLIVTIVLVRVIFAQSEAKNNPDDLIKISS